MQNSNRFSSKFESKSVKELEAIISSPENYQPEAVQAAEIELAKRTENGTTEEPLQTELIHPKGEDRYDDFSRRIDKKSSFAGTPKYVESFQTNIPSELIHSIAIKAFERLEWDVVFSDKTQVEAKRKNDFNSWTEKITVTSNDTSNVSVKSISLGSEIWDNGRNSKRVKLFIHVFQEVESEFDSDKIKELEEEVLKSDNWDDYEIPESLPKPKFNKDPQLLFPILAGIISSILLGGLFAVTTKFFYIILLFESGIGIALAYIIFRELS